MHHTKIEGSVNKIQQHLPEWLHAEVKHDTILLYGTPKEEDIRNLII